MTTTSCARLLRGITALALLVVCARARVTGEEVGEENPGGKDEVVTIVDTCGVLDGPRFIGRVVYLAADGRSKPVRDVTFERVGQPGFVTSGSKSKPVRVNRKGAFNFPVLVGVEGRAVVGGGEMEEHTVTEQVSFILKAPGCEDLRVPFRAGEPAGTLAMICPGRAAGQKGAVVK